MIWTHLYQVVDKKYKDDGKKYWRGIADDDESSKNVEAG